MRLTLAALAAIAVVASTASAAVRTPTAAGGARASAGSPPPELYAALDRWNKDLAKLIEQIKGGHLTEKGLEHKLGLAYQEGFTVAQKVDVDVFGSSFADLYPPLARVGRDLLEALRPAGDTPEQRRAAVEQLVAEAEKSWLQVDRGTKAGSVPEVRSALEEISTLADDVKAGNLTDAGTTAAVGSARNAVFDALDRFPDVYGKPFRRFFGYLMNAQLDLADAASGADALAHVQTAKDEKDTLESLLPRPPDAGTPPPPRLVAYWQSNNNSTLDYIVRFEARGEDSYVGVYDGDKGYPCDVGKTLYEVSGISPTYRGTEHRYGSVWKPLPKGHYECESQGTSAVTVTLVYDASAGVGEATDVSEAYRGWHLDIGGAVFNPISAADAARYHR